MSLNTEIAKVLLDGKSHSTTQIAILVDNSITIRPEIAWRASIRGKKYGKERTPNISQGKRILVNDILRHWHNQGKITKEKHNTYCEWKALDIEWIKRKTQGE